MRSDSFVMARIRNQATSHLCVVSVSIISVEILLNAAFINYCLLLDSSFFLVCLINSFCCYLQPGPREGLLKCFIKRNRCSQTYFLFLSLTNGEHFAISCGSFRYILSKI